MKAPRNRSLVLSPAEEKRFAGQCIGLHKKTPLKAIANKTICQDLFSLLPWLPEKSFDLIFADPPYNLNKRFGSISFSRQSREQYVGWLNSWLPHMARLLKADGSIYVCGDWRSGSALEEVLTRHFVVHNRITWEREKGRAARNNWKSAHEDIWFASLSGHYRFFSEQVKLMRRVLAPYRDEMRRPKDWQNNGQPMRLTGSSNLWTDLTVPFWSMPENTEHPTQKPEKLLAKIILASSAPGDVVFDPFAGAGTTQVVAKKLGRQYVGVEINPHYCALAEKRLFLAEQDQRIQGYENNLFWERNTRPVG